MEGFNYQINDPNEGGDAIDHLGFINRNDFSNSDVDQVLFEAQDSLLGSIEPINGCQDSSSFLNPINDILNDINEFSKNFCCDQVGSFQSLQPSSVPQQNMNNYNNSWALQENAETSSVPSYVNLADMSKSVNGASNCVENGYFNMNAGNDNTVMLPDTAVEFPGADCAFLGGEYSSTINQWFQTLEQQQMSFMTAPLSTVPLPTHMAQSGVHPSQGYTDTFLSTIGSLPASTTITPITVDEHQLIQHPVSPVQQEVTIEARFANPRSSVLRPNIGEKASMTPMINQMQQQPHEETQKSKLIPNVEQVQLEWRHGGNLAQQSNFCQLQGSSASSTHSNAMLNSNLVPFAAAQQLFQRKSAANLTSRRIPSIGFQKNRLHWTAVFPRKHFIQPPEMIIMHPLRTRKLMASRRVAPSSCGSSTTINLAEYFDTSSIDIPMIRERTRTENKNENRRKQKLHIIPGSENLIFEVQRNDFYDSSEFIHIAPSVSEQYNVEVDPYPETELPELDEIFKRKKKTTSMPGAGNKRTCPLSQTFIGSGGGGGVGAGAPPSKKQCQSGSTQQQVPVQESSASFEEKISVSIAIRKGRSNISIDKNDLIYSSESDSGESYDEKGKTDTQSGKSLKCQKCRKLFKTARSLAIHTKRCTAIPCESSAFSETQSSHEEDDTNNNDNMDNNNSCCSSSNNSENYKRSIHNSNSELKNSSKLSRIPQENSFEMHLNSSSNFEDEMHLKMMGSNDENKARPITRSQTRRSTGRSVQVTNTIKRSK